MAIADALLERAHTLGVRSIAVVGTSKNAGKSVVVAALIERLRQTGCAFGLCSMGRDGEAIDAIEGTPKPRFLLPAGTVFATAAALVPRSPACEIFDVTEERSAFGRIVLARSRAAGFVEVVGPPSASALRRVVAALQACAPLVVIDGAVDRLAALRGGRDAIVVAVGAASGPTIPRVAELAQALVARLRLPLVDVTRPFVREGGALTAARAANYAREGETRQIAVPDATHIAFGGRAFLQLAARLDLRCERALHPIACTIAPFWSQRAFDPALFARSVAARTGLVTYDVFSGAQTLPSGA